MRLIFRNDYSLPPLVHHLDPTHGKAIFDGDSVKFPVVDAKLLGPIFLLDHWGCKKGKYCE
jgi:hypothetical protein